MNKSASHQRHPTLPIHFDGADLQKRRLIDHQLFAEVQGLRCVMNWKKERDLLIAQTMEFVQSVTGKQTGTEARPTTRQFGAGPIATEPAIQVEQVTAKQTTAEQTIAASPASHPSQARLTGFREEIQGRVAAFRAHQELFHRERDEYFNSVLTKARTPIEKAPKATGARPAET